MKHNIMELKFSKTARTKYNIRARKKILDTVFSEYIRRRDANENGICRCITCGKQGNWKYEMDCGHFITRNHTILRFDERNCHSQCPACNRFKGGEQYQHGVMIDKIHGQGTAQLLKLLSEQKLGKLDGAWIEERIEYFRSKIKMMKIKNNC